MSYDLAVWEGERPADDAAAGLRFEELYAEYVESDGPGAPPTERIAAYVAALLKRWPDLDEDEDDTSPWSSSPLIGEASGPFLYFPMRWSMAVEAAVFAAETARSMGLTCYDPQSQCLIT
ncbi:hypothetical protein [Kitasatospora sp. NPDC101183]|uniref:hypothetical protein n=1 Tax=Kitasatospora sp. NPDC101183 TaxID=3364100 RepID=UPI0038066479